MAANQSCEQERIAGMLTKDLDLALALARELARALRPRRHSDLALALARASDLPCARDLVLAPVVVLGLALARDLDLDLDLALDRSRDRAATSTAISKRPYFSLNSALIGAIVTRPRFSRRPFGPVSNGVGRTWNCSPCTA